MGAACAKQHGGDPVFTTLRHDEIGPLTLVSGYSAEDFLAPDRPAMGAMHIGRKAALIKINNVVPAMFGDPMPQLAEKCNSFFATTFNIPRRFF